MKTKDGRGATVKHALKVPAAANGHLGAQAAEFAVETLDGAGSPVAAKEPAPAAEVRTVRAARADLGPRHPRHPRRRSHHGDRTGQELARYTSAAVARTPPRSWPGSTGRAEAGS